MVDPKTTTTQPTHFPFTDTNIVEVDYEESVPAHDAFAAVDEELIDERGEISDAGWDLLADWDGNGELV